MRVTTDLYRVTVFESERGWGQKVLSVETYTTKAEADAAAWDVNKNNNSKSAPDYYIAATVEKIG